VCMKCVLSANAKFIFGRARTRLPIESTYNRIYPRTPALLTTATTSNMADTEDVQLVERFAPTGAELEPDVMAELQSIMRLHSIDVQELWYKWESYSMKMGSDDMKLNIETARALKKDVQDSLERESRSKAHVLHSNKRAGGATPRNVSSNADVFGMLDGLVPNTPRVGSAARANGTGKRKFETPSMSRVKAEPASSPPEFKTPHKPGEHTGPVYVSFPNTAHRLTDLKHFISRSTECWPDGRSAQRASCCARTSYCTLR
jgi:hypothetical protein